MVPVAEAASKSSGGYSRSGGSSRTPSVGGGSGGYRTPSTRSSTSGGYSRPAPSPSRPRYQAPTSAGDTSFSRESSGSALDTFTRRQQESARPRPQPEAVRPPRYEQEPVRRPRYETETQPQVRRPSTRPRPAPVPDSGWYGQRGWNQPTWNVPNRSFGVWDGLFLWTLLSNLDRPGSAGWFHDNQNDPGYLEWRREIERQAVGDADLKRRIDELDRKLRETDARPRTPGAVPADVPVEVAQAKPVQPAVPTANAPAPTASGGLGGTIVLILLGLALVGGIAFLLLRRRSSGPEVTAGGGAVGRSAPSSARTPAVDAEAASRKFRIGMTVSVDPSPFILAGSAVKVSAPGEAGSGRSDVEAVGHVVSGGTRLVRLHLAGGRHVVQLHLDAAGDPDECRLFETIDEVEPADADEWGVWLDDKEGMIGWPDFQTKDGKTYDRVWAQSETRTAPRRLVETREDATGVREVESKAMLYAAATGAEEPGPATEYLLVSAVEDGARAWVQIQVGIDINPTTLKLA